MKRFAGLLAAVLLIIAACTAQPTFDPTMMSTPVSDLPISMVGDGPQISETTPVPVEVIDAADAEYMPVLEDAVARVEAFAPEAVVVALGLDGFEGDPFGGLSISTDGFGKIGARLAKLNLPTVLVQEGGYLCDELGLNLESFLDGFGNR